MAEMRVKGFKLEYVANALGCSSRTLKRHWRKRVNNSFHDKQRSGRPQKLTRTCKMVITKNVCNKWGASTRSCTKKLNNTMRYRKENRTVSRSTVKIFILKQKWGKIAYKKPIKPLLTEKSKRDRLTFCQWLEDHGYF